MRRVRIERPVATTQSPSASPCAADASIASGTSEVSVSPGSTFASRNQGRPCSVDDEIDAGEVAEAERACARIAASDTAARPSRRDGDGA